MPDSVDSSRRRFLKSAGVAGSALFLQLRSARRAFGEDLHRALDRENPFSDLRQAYGLADDVTYLNHASIGTIPKSVQASHRRYLEICETNPWLHMWGDAWKEPREEVRNQAASWLSCAPSEITFSHNTTETFNVLAQGLPLGPGDEVLFSQLNHSGASVCWEHAAEARGFTVRRFDFPVHDVPGMTADDVVASYAEAIRPETRVLVLPHIDNTVGLRHPVAAIARSARNLGVEFIAVDAAQSVGMLPIEVAELGVDVYATSAHKWLQGPKGLGLAYIKESIQDRLRPMWVTWGQKRWTESARKYEDYGTRNLAEVLTLGDAMTFQARLDSRALEAHHRRLFDQAREWVDGEEGLTWHSPRDWRLGSAIYSVGFKGPKSSELFSRLFESEGFVFRPFEVHGLNAIRISPNAANTAAEVAALIRRIR